MCTFGLQYLRYELLPFDFWAQCLGAFRFCTIFEILDWLIWRLLAISARLGHFLPREKHKIDLSEEDLLKETSCFEWFSCNWDWHSLDLFILSACLHTSSFLGSSHSSFWVKTSLMTFLMIPVPTSRGVYPPKYRSGLKCPFLTTWDWYIILRWSLSCVCHSGFFFGSGL